MTTTKPIIGIDHGYYAVKTSHFVLPAGVVAYEHEPYTPRGVLEYGGKYYVCGSGRQPLVREKTANDNYYLLTLAAIAKELKRRGMRQGNIILAAGLPLTGFGRDKESFRGYLCRAEQPEVFRYEGEDYEVTIEDAIMFPQGYSALAVHSEVMQDDPSVLLVDIGGWTVDIMRLDNNIPNAATCRSLEQGVIRCIDDILEQVWRNVGLTLTPAQVENVLRGKNCKPDGPVKETILSQGRAYILNLLSAMMEAGFDVKAVPVVFMGGGAGIAKRFIEPGDGLCQAAYITDVHANALGYERIALKRMNLLP